MEFFVARSIFNHFKGNNFDSKILKDMKLPIEIMYFLKDMSINPEQLWPAIEYTKEISSKETGYLGGNALSILNFIEGKICDADFSNCCLKGAQLSASVITNCSFKNTVLTESELSSSLLSSSEFKDCDFTNILLKPGSIKKTFMVA